MIDAVHGQAVVVIGGSSGIGLEIARQVSARGATLVIMGRDPAKLAATTEQLDGSVTTIALDAHDESAPRELCRASRPSITSCR